MIALATEFLQSEPAEVYHAKAQHNLSSHALADFRKSPLLYHRKKAGLIPQDDRPAFVIGQAAHTLILEGKETFESEFAFGGPINPKTGCVYGCRTKAYSEWMESQGKPVLTDSQLELVQSMNAGFRRSQPAMALVSSGQAEAVVRTQYCGLPCQIRMDWFNPQVGIVDLKTCDDLTWFASDARRYGYLHQLSFYRNVLQQVMPQHMSVFLIAVEKKEPYRCGVWRVSDEVLGIAKRENEQAIEQLKRCMANDHWPTGYEDMRTFDYL